VEEDYLYSKKIVCGRWEEIDWFMLKHINQLYVRNVRKYLKMKLYCKDCFQELETSDASHMLFNKGKDVKKHFLSCANRDCSAYHIIVALVSQN